MRVIAGTYRSRPLRSPAGLQTRPTSDRLRETLFNVLAPRIAGAVFVDLYAGSGAVGIEALSRGAAEVVFVEQAPAALAVLRGNLDSLQIATGFVVRQVSVSAALKRETRVFDVVFLDPPYEADKEYEQALAMLGGEYGHLLAEGAVVIAEHRRKQATAERYGRLERFRLLEQGDAGLSFYKVKEV